MVEDRTAPIRRREGQRASVIPATRSLDPPASCSTNCRRFARSDGHAALRAAGAGSRSGSGSRWRIRRPATTHAGVRVTCRPGPGTENEIDSNRCIRGAALGAAPRGQPLLRGLDDRIPTRETTGCDGWTRHSHARRAHKSQRMISSASSHGQPRSTSLATSCQSTCHANTAASTRPIPSRSS